MHHVIVGTDSLLVLCVTRDYDLTLRDYDPILRDYDLTLSDCITDFDVTLTIQIDYGRP